jgi:MFS family permease
MIFHQKMTKISHFFTTNLEFILLNFFFNFQGTIIWNSKIQNLLFSATFWGALLTSIPAGYLADRTSPSNMIQISMLILTISTVLFPYMAMNASWQFVFISRVLTGCGNVASKI